MKAVALTEFGSAGVLSVQDLPEPLVGPDSVLLTTGAAGVNPVDYKIREGHLSGLLPHHMPLIPGWDVAGVVRAVGPAVVRFRPGDPVYGYIRQDHVQHGSYAELVSTPERTLAAKPATLDSVHAAAVPLAGLTALQTLRAAGVGEGDTVLVHAAAGGVGHFAVQIAGELGARVVGTASESNHAFLRQLGAEPVRYGEGLERRLADVLGGDGLADAAVDFAGGEALEQSPSLLRDRTRHASVMDPEQVLQQGGQYVFVRPDAEQLGWLGALVDAGRLRVEVQRTLPLEQAAEAHHLLEDGHVRGKLVLTAG